MNSEVTHGYFFDMTTGELMRELRPVPKKERLFYRLAMKFMIDKNKQACGLHRQRRLNDVGASTIGYSKQKTIA